MNVHSIGYLAFATVLGVFVVSGSAALAAETESQDCKAQHDALHKDFAAAGIAPHVKEEQWAPYTFSAHLGWAPRSNPKSVVTGNDGHSHTVAALTVIRDQLKTAERLCKEGQDYEAMLRMDVVRHMMKLPEMQHPGAHGYSALPSQPLGTTP